MDFDHGLNSAVSRLREALQDSAVTPRFVQTIPRRGYRLLVPVEVENDEVPSAGPDDLHSASPSRRSWRRIWIAGAAAVLTGAIAWVVTDIRTSARSALPPIRLLTVTSFPGSEGGPPALSPDGNFVVLNWTGPDATAAGDLWVKAVDGDAMRRLTDTPGINEVFPAWSPDGRQIAFSRSDGARTGIHLISPVGGPEQQATDSGWGATWLPDSQSFVFFDNSAGSLALFHYVLATGERRQLTTAPAGFVDREPKVSPDGKSIAFVRTTRGQWFGGASRATLFVGTDCRRRFRAYGRLGRTSGLPELDPRQSGDSLSAIGGQQSEGISRCRERRQGRPGGRIAQQRVPAFNVGIQTRRNLPRGDCRRAVRRRPANDRLARPAIERAPVGVDGVQ